LEYLLFEAALLQPDGTIRDLEPGEGDELRDIARREQARLRGTAAGAGTPGGISDGN
jgi:hypothetical protein